jgi:hypothetical protein
MTPREQIEEVQEERGTSSLFDSTFTSSASTYRPESSSILSNVRATAKYGTLSEKG